MEEIGSLIKNIADKLKTSTEKELKKYDLTLSQSRVLLYLDSQGGEAKQKEIQKFLQVTHPTVIGILARLENKGFVYTWIDARNKKENIVGLTERAIFVVENMERARGEREMLLKKGLNDKEIEVFENILQRVFSNVEGSITKKPVKKSEEKKPFWFHW